jgi:hypothetical protein
MLRIEAMPQPFPAARLAELVRSRGYAISSRELARLTGMGCAKLHRLCTSPDANPSWKTISELLDILAYAPRDLFQREK